MVRYSLFVIPSIVFAGIAMLAPSKSPAQCQPGAIVLAPTYEMIRTGNNTTKAYAASVISGPFTPWYFPRVKLTQKLNGSVIFGPITHQPTSPPGVTKADLAHNTTIQSTGIGTYRVETEHWVNSPYCEALGYTPIHTPFVTELNIQRPGRPDYCPSCANSLYYLGHHLGSPVAWDGSYTANASLVPGATNGATGTPQWIISQSGSIGQLSCTNCSQPVFQAIGRSAHCESYDVVITTSYRGFESDSFWLFINAPHKAIAVNDPVGGVWNYTQPWGNGWQSWINYKTESLCWTDGPMSDYSMNETRSLFVNDYPGRNSWSIPTLSSWSVPFDHWVDHMSFQCPAGSCTPMPLNPGPNTEKVHHADQFFQVGKPSIGSGITIQKNRFQRYRDEGRHEAIQTPAP